MVLKPHNLDFVVKKDLADTFLHMEAIKNAENRKNLTLKKPIDRDYQKIFS